MTTWNVEKTDENRYHLSSRDLMDDEVDGPQLVGRLLSSGLTEAQARDIPFSLDPKIDRTPLAQRFNHN